tara:strand:- start:18 stop:545 length:528 start_codon:yes stop_codon:yes gene_type:complete
MVVLSVEKFKLEDYKTGNRLTNEINYISSTSFGHSTISPTVQTYLSENNIIGYLEQDGQVVASGFGLEDTYTTGSKTLYIHTFGTRNEYMGQGFCTKIVNEFIKKFGKTHLIYLTVRTESDNVNIGAIKCYEKNGFIMLPEVYRDHYDGKNSAMVRIPDSKKKTKKKKRKKTKRY